MQLDEIIHTDKRQVLMLVSPKGKIEQLEMAFTDFLKQRGLENIGPLVSAGNVWCNVQWIAETPQADIYMTKASQHQISVMKDALTKLGMGANSRCSVWTNGVLKQQILWDIKPVRAFRPKRIKPAKPSLQLQAAEQMGVTVLDDNVKNMRLGRVVWQRTPTIRTHDPSSVSLDEDHGQYPGVYAIHVTNDVEFWFHRLIDDYGNDAVAWEIEIIGARGDVLVEDVQYRNKFDGHGYEEDADAAILLTTRAVLREGIDFKYVQQLSDDHAEDHRYR